MSVSAPAAPASALAPAPSLIVPRRFTKLDQDLKPLDPTRKDWAAIRVETGALAFELLRGNIGDRAVPHAEAVDLAGNVDALGLRDWRLWTLDEAEAIRDISRYNPAVDTDVFDDIKPDFHWTASPDASDEAYAWCVDFHYGYAGLVRRCARAWVRAVRSFAPASQ